MVFVKNNIWKKSGERNVWRNVTLFTNKNNLEKQNAKEEKANRVTEV